MIAGSGGKDVLLAHQPVAPKLANERSRININQRVPEFVRKQLK